MNSVWLEAALLLPKRRLWVLPLPKCQSTIIKAMLVALDGRQPPQALLPGERSLGMAVHAPLHHGLQRFGSLPELQRQQLLRDDTWLRITVVRDPLERLLSFWWHKLVLFDPGYQAFAREMPAEVCDASSFTSLRAGWQQFLDLLRERPELLDLDHHLIPQEALAAADTVDYSHIIVRDQFHAFWQNQLSCLPAAEAGLPQQVLDHYQRLHLPQLDLLHLIAPTSRQRRQVERLYGRDYAWLKRLPNWKPLGPVSAAGVIGTDLVLGWIEQARDSHRLIAVATGLDALALSSSRSWPEHNCPESGYGKLYEALQRQESALVLNSLTIQSQLDGEGNYLLGVCYHLCGDQHQALRCFERCEQQGFFTPYVLFNRGNVWRALKEEAKAVACYQEALAWFPSFGECQTNCALALEQMERFDEAERLLRQRLLQKNDDIQAWFLLGNILRRRKRPKEAVEAFRGCLQLAPQHCDALNNLGLAFSDMRQPGQAEICYRQALSMDASYLNARRNLAQLLVRERRHEEAWTHYELWASASSEPGERLVATLGGVSVLTELDRCEQALALSDAMPSLALALFCRCAVIPVLYDSAQQVSSVRERLEADLVALQEAVASEDLEPWEWQALYRGLFCVSHFYLAYQLRNDRTFQQRFAEIASTVLRHRVTEPLNQPSHTSSMQRSPRVGFISAHMRRHNGAYWALGWVRALVGMDPAVELFCYNLGDEEDDATESFAQLGTYRHLPLDQDNLEQVVTAVRADQLDLLLFTDVGMHAPSRVLAYFRLATVQAAAWGHPVTTGSGVMDFYLSGAGMEDASSQEWYSERLVLLPGTGLVYANPELPPKEDDLRQDLHLPSQSPLLLSLQSTFKYHPAFDLIYARILEDAPEACCVLVDHMGHRGLGQKLRSRLASAGSDPDALLDRFRLLQRIPHHTYVSLFCEAHHVLDTPGWNGGNSSFQSLSMGCPVVTLRGDSMRGRHTVAMLEIIELPVLIAHSIDEYVALSHRLLHDEDFAQHCRAVIRRHGHRLFNDQDVAEAFRQWVLEVVALGPS